MSRVPFVPVGDLPHPAAEITRILLVDPRWGRRGHGSRLRAACVAIWRDNDFETAVAWAYEQDAMVKFLGSAGWAPDGAAGRWTWTTSWSPRSGCMWI